MIRLPCTVAGRQSKCSREQQFRTDVLHGLNANPKRLPCKYFYDQRGSQLFDAICEMEEYYLTRSELAIMRRNSSQMAEELGQGVMLIEFGSGSSIKTRVLLNELRGPLAYLPVDISREHLWAAARRLSHRYPHVEVLPVWPISPPTLICRIASTIRYGEWSTFPARRSAILSGPRRSDYWCAWRIYAAMMAACSSASICKKMWRSSKRPTTMHWELLRNSI